MASLIERMLSMGDKKRVKVLADTDFFNDKKSIVTKLPVLNVALSGSLKGGLMPGLTILAGESKSFKSLLSLFLAKQFQEDNKDGVILFYDSEFGSKPGYLEGFGIDTSRVLHIPIMNIEELLFDLTPRLEAIDGDKDKVFILIDSIGNLASKKEAQDALDGKSVQDMTRARSLKGMFRTVTPYFALKSIYCVAVAHTYKTMEIYAKTVMSGGQGPLYSADTVFIITKSQEKDESGVTGFNFNITIEKSRSVREKARLSFKVTYKEGIQRWSNFWDWAVQAGAITEASKGWYQKVDLDTGEVLGPKTRRADIEKDVEFWKNLNNNKAFGEWVENRYRLKALTSDDSEQQAQDDQVDQDDQPSALDVAIFDDED